MARSSKRRSVSATKAARSFGTLVDRVREAGAVYEVESHGQVVAEIRPAPRRFTVKDLSALFASGQKAPAEFLEAIEAGRREASGAPEAPAPRLSGRGGARRRVRR